MRLLTCNTLGLKRQGSRYFYVYPSLDVQTRVHFENVGTRVFQNVILAILFEVKLNFGVITKEEG